MQGRGVMVQCLTLGTRTCLQMLSGSWMEAGKPLTLKYGTYFKGWSRVKDFKVLGVDRTVPLPTPAWIPNSTCSMHVL